MSHAALTMRRHPTRRMKQPGAEGGHNGRVSDSAVLFDITDGVATITLNRPEARNAYNGDVSAGLAAAYERCDGDDSVRAVVVTGTPPAFCAGADLGRGQDTFLGQAAGDTFSAAALRYPAWRVRKPVIAAVNGHAIGVGFNLTLQCDMRIMALDAKYAAVQVRRGVLGDAYAHWTLPRMTNQAVAAEILLTGRTFDGHQAKEWGLCTRALPNDEVLPAALEIARDIAENTAPLSVAASKEILWRTWQSVAADIEAAETAAHRIVMAHDDCREGVMAYIERRRPNWTGSVSSTFPTIDR